MAVGAGIICIDRTTMFTITAMMYNVYCVLLCTVFCPYSCFNRYVAKLIRNKEILISFRNVWPQIQKVRKNNKKQQTEMKISQEKRQERTTEQTPARVTLSEKQFSLVNLIGTYCLN